MLDPNRRDPIVYGSPDQFIEWLESARRLVEIEPDEVFHHAAVRRSLDRFASLIVQRAGEPPHPDDQSTPRRPE